MIREVKLSDASSIANIYNYYVENTVITFEEELITDKDMSDRIENVVSQFPYIVYEEDDKVIGFAYASKFRVRSAYRFSVEVTVYLEHTYCNKGIGIQLFSGLLDELRKKDYHVAIGAIALPNDASVILHEKLGFSKVAYFKDIGYKFDQWVDVGYWQLEL